MDNSEIITHPPRNNHSSKMIHVVIDTNILRGEGLISPNMQILQRLLIVGDIKLIIPEIVLKEYISQEEEEFEKNIQNFLTR